MRKIALASIAVIAMSSPSFAEGPAAGGAPGASIPAPAPAASRPAARTAGPAGQAAPAPVAPLAAPAPAAAAGVEPQASGAAAPPAPAVGGARAAWPFAGEVFGQEVNLRAGPSTSYEVMARLADGERVTVLAESFGWYAVRPSRDVPVYVHHDLVEETAPGFGAILRDRVNVRARPAAEASVVGQAGRGDLVRLAGREGDWVALHAPEHATLYVHRDFVRRVSGDLPESAPLAADVTAGPAGAPAAAPARRDATDILIEARDLYLAQLDLSDLDAMDFTSAMERYEEALERATRPSVRQAAEAGIRQVQIALRLQEDYRARMRRLDEAQSNTGGGAAGTGQR